MSQPPMDNGEWMMRAQREAQKQYNSTPQRPEPEDTTGLKLLEEFLTKRRSERDGDDPGERE